MKLANTVACEAHVTKRQAALLFASFGLGLATNVKPAMAELSSGFVGETRALANAINEYMTLVRSLMFL